RSCSALLFSSRRRHTRSKRDWSSYVCSSDLGDTPPSLNESKAKLKFLSASLYGIPKSSNLDTAAFTPSSFINQTADVFFDLATASHSRISPTDSKFQFSGV